MKKIISISFLIIGILCVVYFFSREKKVSSEIKSLNVMLQNGISFAKNKDYMGAEKTFNGAIEVLEKEGFKIHPGDLKNFSTLINNLKTNSYPKFLRLMENLNETLKKKIQDLKKSSQIKDDLKSEFCDVMNVSLLEKDFFDKWYESLNLKLKDSLKEKLDIYYNEKNLFKADEKQKNQYKNRIMLYGVFPDYFAVPVTEYEINFNMAIMYHSKGEFENSNDFLRKIMKVVPFYTKPYILTARNYEKLGDFENSIKILLKAKNDLPDNEEVLTELAAFYYKTGKKDHAKKMLDQALRVNPEYTYAKEGGKVLERKKANKLKSSAFYKEKIKENGESLSNLSNLALSYLKENKKNESDEIVKKALKQYSNDPFLLKLQGRIFGMQKKYKEALNSFKKAMKNQNKPDSEIYVLMGITLFNQYLNEDAYDILKQGLELFPNDPYINFNLGLVCEATPQFRNNAASFYEKYLKLKPDSGNKIKITKKIRELRYPQKNKKNN